MDIMAIFLKVLNMSIAATWVALAVLVLRFLLKKAPKWIAVALWGMVALRLVCPFSIESMLSLIPSRETIPEEIIYWEGEGLHQQTQLNVVQDTALYEPVTVELDTPVGTATAWELYASAGWMGGILLMAGYATVSYLRLKRKVAPSMHISDNIYLCDYIDTPFILGIVSPKIYLPSSMDPGSAAHVLAHERAHLKRKDHWWKPFGFALLAVHWFNPVLWLAYILLCRDIEMACDEKVIRDMAVPDKKAYSEALLRCSVSRRMIAACPLAFGEVGVKERVKTVLNYKKPGFWVVLLAVIALLAAAVCLLTDPVPKTENIEQYFESLNEPVVIMEDRANRTITMTIELTATSGPGEFLVEMMEKNKGVEKWDTIRLGKLHISESFEHTILAGDDYKIQVTPLSGEPGNATFAITREGYKQDPQLKFDLSGSNVSDIDTEETMKHIREFNGMEENQNAYVNGKNFEILLQENFDFASTFIHYFFYQDQKTMGSMLTYTAYADTGTLLGTHECEEQETVYLLQHYLEALRCLPQERIRSMSPEAGRYHIRHVEEGTPESYARVIRYSDQGIGATDGWLVHLEVIPMYRGEDGEFVDAKEEAIHVFYGDTPADVNGVILDAKILEISNKSYLVEPMPGSAELNSADRIWVQMELDADPMPLVGDILRITYDGQLMETYPAQIGKVFRMQVVTAEYGIEVDLGKRIAHFNDTVSLGIQIPESWEYERVNSAGDGSILEIRFRPKGKEGWVSLRYESAPFGVCGTGLVTEDVTFGGHKGTQGFYDGRNIWSFIRIQEDLPGDFVILNDGADSWLHNANYHATLWKMLETIVISEVTEPNDAETVVPVTKVYQYEKEGFGSDFVLTLFPDGTFQYYEGALSSYIGTGNWNREGDILTIYDKMYLKNQFRVDGDALVFLAEGSTNFTYIEVADGERFYLQEG